MSQNNRLYLFVYGTLRPPQANVTDADAADADSRYYSEIAKHVIRHEPAILPDAALHNIGTYPAIIGGEGGVYDALVYGDLLEVEPEALAITDRIEDHPNLYTRQLTDVQTADGPIKAWVYWAPDTMVANKPRIESGDWFRRAIDPQLADHVKRFADSKCSWLATVREDGRAHCAPMWHVWYRGRIYLVAQPTSIKMKNIAHSPYVTITHPDPSNVVIIEGQAIEAPAMEDVIQPLMLAKYEWDISTDAKYQTVIEITPLKLMTWNNGPTQRWQRDEILKVW